MYKITFTVDELNRFNLIQNDEIRKSAMSIYSYMLKLNENENKKLTELGLIETKDIYKIKISFRKFLSAYNRNHFKISIATLKTRIDKLIELKLIAKETVQNVFRYTFCRYLNFTFNKSSNELPNNQNVPEAVENTNVDDDLHKHKDLNTRTYIQDLDSYKSQDNFDYEHYLSSNEKCNWNEIISLLPKIFSLLKVKSQWIKGQVISKLYNYSEKITKKHMVKYICSVIINARRDYYNNYSKYVQNQQVNAQWNDYEQRTYDFNVLEKKLLGWNVN